MGTRTARLFAHLRTSAGRPAIVRGGAPTTFGELDALSRRYARGLWRLGIRPGDRVAVFAEGAPEVVVALLGHYRLGAIHVPINTRYRAEEAGHVLSDSGAKAVLFSPGVVGEVLAGIGPLPDLSHRIALPGDGPLSGSIPFESLLAGEPLEGAPDPDDHDTALLIYTSGTTGKSKGVALPYAAIVENIGALTDLWRFSPADRLVLALPLFHVHGLGIGLHAMLLHGLTAILCDRFDPARVVEAFASEGATVFMGVPTMYVRLLAHLAEHPRDAEALARGRLFTSGSAPLPADDFRAFFERTGHAILERYGMSETLFTLSNPYDGERRPGTVGLPVPGCAMRLVDEDGKDAAPGELGEILVKSNGIMSGYWGREEDTRKSFENGWFLTGDVARVSADGYVTIAGRKSVDLIKSGGFKISAREIEDVLRRHALVADVAVLGVPDRVWGERIVAAVVLRGAAAPGEDELLFDLAEFAGRHLADYKRPRGLLLVEELPRNALGKVQKHLLAARLRKG